jgi:hypothetical protein
MRWAARALAELPPVPQAAEGDPVWHPLQHFFGLTAFGANVFVATRGDETLVEAHDERGSEQEELYLVLDGEAEFQLDGETLIATRGTVVAIPDPTVVRQAAARTSGTALLVIGVRPGCFETTWRSSHFTGLPRAER